MQRWLLLFLVALTPCRAGVPEKLGPNAKIVLEFPELPETFFAQLTGKKQPAILSAQLPENYSLDGRSPIFVYLGGGNGGPGDNSAFARQIVGPRDFIAVNLPLFNDATPKDQPTPKDFRFDISSMVNGNDAALIRFHAHHHA